MGILEIITAAVGGSAVLIGAVAWLIRSLTVHVLSQDLESFKTKLQSAAFEHQVRFTNLHERRASIIAELYNKLVVLHDAASSFVRWYVSVSSEEKRQRLEQLWRAADDYNTYFGRHRIYFDQATCDKIVSLNEALSKACSMLASFAHEGTALAVSHDQIFDEWKKALGVLDQDVPKVKQTLEDSFRQLLGVEVGK